MFEFLQTVGTGFWATLLEMAPYLLFGFLVAGVLSVLIPASLVERHLGGRSLWAVVKASAFGVPLPLCSCGVIPVSASLRRHGASRGATAAFLLSTPQTGVDSIMVTLSLLGPIFAVFRPLAALVTGVVGGGLVSAFDGNGNGASDPPPACQDACCTGDGRQSKAVGALRYGFVTLPRDIGRSLLVGLVLAGLISALVPKDLAQTVGTGFLGMVVMMVLGLPIYVCATASVPIAAALILKGVSPGAAFVFLMTGPATNAATIATIWKVLGRRTALIILATAGIGALLLGTLLDLIYTRAGAVPAPHMHELIPHALKVACAIALLLILAAAIFRRPAPTTHDHAADGADTLTLAIEGMTCSHCAASVERALGEQPAVASAQVDLKSGTALVAGHGLDVRSLCRAVEELGYTASVSQQPGSGDDTAAVRG